MLGWLPLRAPPTALSSIGDPEVGKRGGLSLPLAVRLAPRAALLSAEPVTASTPQVPQQAARQRAAPRAAAAQKAAPPPLLASRAPTAIESLPPDSASRPAPRGDFLADLAARRSAREQAERPAQAPPPPGALTFGTASGAGGLSADGGLFRVEHMSSTDATLVFYRLNRGMQRVDIGIGSNLSIQLAIVRAVIGVMRENGFSGDVTWMSQRLGRDVQISARERDATQLEAFLLLEFFSADPIRRPPDTAGAR
jgi:hypothetical protein